MYLLALFYLKTIRLSLFSGSETQIFRSGSRVKPCPVHHYPSSGQPADARHQTSASHNQQTPTEQVHIAVPTQRQGERTAPTKNEQQSLQSERGEIWLSLYD